MKIEEIIAIPPPEHELDGEKHLTDAGREHAEEIAEHLEPPSSYTDTLCFVYGKQNWCIETAEIIMANFKLSERVRIKGVASALLLSAGTEQMNRSRLDTSDVGIRTIDRLDIFTYEAMWLATGIKPPHYRVVWALTGSAFMRGILDLGASSSLPRHPVSVQPDWVNLSFYSQPPGIKRHRIAEDYCAGHNRPITSWDAVPNGRVV